MEVHDIAEWEKIVWMLENKMHIKSAFVLSLLVNTECRTTRSVPSSIWLFMQLKKKKNKHQKPVQVLF